MILTCSSCGAAASLEAWINDRDWRDLVALIPRVPAQLQGRALSYLGLWRTGKRALRPAKAHRILTELLDLVESGTVHWDRGETRPAPLELWAQALDAVIERRPQALTNHNYLKHTAWEMAATLAAQAERTVHHRVAENVGAPPAIGAPKRMQKTCYTCGSFRPPKGCSANMHPVSGNLILGCGDGWTEKVASVSDLMAGLAAGLKEQADESEANPPRGD